MCGYAGGAGGGAGEGDEEQAGPGGETSHRYHRPGTQDSRQDIVQSIYLAFKSTRGGGICPLHRRVFCRELGRTRV